MRICPACGHANPEGGKFCSQCGAPLVASSPAGQERKVVTVLFADLVGFTSRSEQLDPEDVRAFLSPYYTRLRSELERFGGTVEKFIGDAVMALFGAPVTHEDDAERAVRAALAIRDWVLEDEPQLQLRIAVNTGEVLVTLDASAAQGEGMASGDVVNTTARLQTAAPVNGILVGAATYRATNTGVSYRAAEPVAAKGKAEPVQAWLALEARSRLGVDLVTAGRAPLVGRRNELEVMRDGLARVRRDRSPHLLSLVGVPGIGKSRLVGELRRAVDEDPELLYWRQGRSLPYGDGTTFWALAEMVKAEAGLLETDEQVEATEKLRVSVGNLIPEGEDVAWVEGHLRPLVGLSSDPAGGSDRRDEAFTAWRRYLEGLAEKGPLVLVFEDLHWADDNMLDFIEHLVDWVSDVPMLIVCTARPELFERRVGWGGGTRHATTLSLSTLSDDETTELINGMGDAPVLPPETQQALLARAGGNPLYAEQYVRMIAERGDLAAMPLPETVQGIIAARLDALAAEEKSLLQSAAVMGKVFWLGAIGAANNMDRRGVEMRLHGLARKDFVQRARRSSVANEEEYSFLHVLVRDVAYGQIPRVRRAEQHRLAAEWIRSLGRSEDHAELLAHHYVSAIELRRAAGQETDATLAAQALESLSAAGDRAAALNAYASAAAFYESALDLAEPNWPGRARMLFNLCRVRFIGGSPDDELLTDASAALLACGDVDGAAEAEALLAAQYWQRGMVDQSSEHLQRAGELIESRPASRSKAIVLVATANLFCTSGDYAGAIRIGREALAMAEKLGREELRAPALIWIGIARLAGADVGGLDDLRLSIEVARNANAPAEICRAQTNLSAMLYQRGWLVESCDLSDQAAEVASRFGLKVLQRWLRGENPGSEYLLGRWDEALTGADEFLAEVEAGAPHYVAAACYVARAQIRYGRDDVSGALGDAERALELTRVVKEPQHLVMTLPAVAHLIRETGNTDRAGAFCDELIVILRDGVANSQLECLHVFAWTLAALGRGQELLDALPEIDSQWVQAAAAFASGDIGRAADICGAMGAVSEEARDRIWLAEKLLDQGNRQEADSELQRALAFYRSVDATRYVRQCEKLLAEVSATLPARAERPIR